jgi:hypothetical protein
VLTKMRTFENFKRNQRTFYRWFKGIVGML